MYFRAILSGTLAALLLTVAAGNARDAAPLQRDLLVGRPAAELPGVFGGRSEKPADIQVAQAQSDPRVVALEEQIRTLNGTMEELNFQILQLQEQIRKMQ